MFDNVPIQKRLRTILILMGAVFLISLFYGSQVLEIYDKIETLEAKNRTIEEADLELLNRQVRLKELGTSIREVEGQGGVQLSDHSAFLVYTEEACQKWGLKLVSFPIETVEDLDGYQVAQIDFSLEGMFHDLLAFLYQVEYQDRVGSVSWINLERKTLRLQSLRKEVLIAQVRLYRMLSLHDKQDA